MRVERVYRFPLLAVLPCCACVRVFLFLDVVLDVIFVFAGCSCSPCAVVAVLKSFNMVVVCFTEPVTKKDVVCDPEV